jgi:hypothetical protein
MWSIAIWGRKMNSGMAIIDFRDMSEPRIRINIFGEPERRHLARYKVTNS